MPPQQSYQTEQVQRSVFRWQPNHSLESKPQHSSKADIHSAFLTHTDPAKRKHLAYSGVTLSVFKTRMCNTQQKICSQFANGPFKSNSMRNDLYEEVNQLLPPQSVTRCTIYIHVCQPDPRPGLSHQLIIRNDTTNRNKY